MTKVTSIIEIKAHVYQITDARNYRDCQYKSRANILTLK